jgi:hypothetical protein
VHSQRRAANDAGFGQPARTSCFSRAFATSSSLRRDATPCSRASKSVVQVSGAVEWASAERAQETATHRASSSCASRPGPCLAPRGRHAQPRSRPTRLARRRHCVRAGVSAGGLRRASQSALSDTHQRRSYAFCSSLNSRSAAAQTGEDISEVKSEATNIRSRRRPRHVGCAPLRCACGRLSGWSASARLRYAWTRRRAVSQCARPRCRWSSAWAHLLDVLCRQCGRASAQAQHFIWVGVEINWFGSIAHSAPGESRNASEAGLSSRGQRFRASRRV